MRVAFLGLGRMGAAMAAHVLAAGHELVVWNRTPGRAGDLTAAGAREVQQAAAAVDGAEAVVLMLFGPDSVRAVLAEVLPRTVRGALLVNATTVGPQDAREFAAICDEHGVRYVDGPVAGTVGPARDGTLGVLAGAREADYDDALPLLRLWGDPDKVRRVGEVGAGSGLKLCVNQSLGVVAAGVGESLRLGRELGLDPAAVLQVLGGTAYGAFLGQKGPMLAARDFRDTAFSLDLLVKDLDLAVGAAGVAAPVTESALAQARATAALGRGGQDYATLAAAVADGDLPAPA